MNHDCYYYFALRNFGFRVKNLKLDVFFLINLLHVCVQGRDIHEINYPIVPFGTKVLNASTFFVASSVNVMRFFDGQRLC